MEVDLKDRLNWEVPDEGAKELMRCDLHVHSWYSGPADLPVLKHIGRECYSEPAAVYEQAIRRGMDLVTLTDHDSIEGALASLALLPLLPMIPIVTACIHAHEVRFGARHFRAFQKKLGWPAEPPLVAAGPAAPARSLGPA